MDFTTLKKILRYTKPYRIYLILGIFTSAAWVSLSLYTPVLIGRAVDFMIGETNVAFAPIIKLLTVLIAVICIGSAFQWITALCTNQIAYRTSRDLHRDLFIKWNSVPLSYIDTHSHGDLISRMINDVDAIADGLLQGFTQIFTGSITILGTLFFMFSIHRTVTLIVVILTPLSLLVTYFIAKRSHHSFLEQANTQGELSGFSEEMIGGQKVVKAFSYEMQSIARFQEINSRLYSQGVKAQFYSSLSNPGTRFINTIVYTTVGVIGSIIVLSGGALTVGDLSSFLIYANQYAKPFNEITGVITQIQTAFAAAKRVFEVLEIQDEEPDAPGAIKMSDCKGEITAEHVSFSYRPETPLIEDFNLFVKSGEKIAIVGPTGCGKTTFINLLMRFYDINCGTVKIDGILINNIQRDNLRSLYGMVLQETWLFEGTISQNISYGKPDATKKEIISAAKRAYAHSFIKRLENGYDTLIKQGGSNLSEGEKQLLCIARVMLLDPPMLILDEATSSIDTMTEARIQKAFSKMMKGRTSFIVAHRLSTIREADQILVMKDGNIIEKGTHESLLEKNGFYASLYRGQFAPTEKKKM